MTKPALTLLAPAKVNLALDVLEKTPENYHKIQTILHECPNLADKIDFYETQENDDLTIANTDLVHLPKKERNLAYRALTLLKKSLQIDKNIHIHIHKNIPISSGLGGASSDAAAVLKGLNKLWNLDLPQEKLAELAAKLGMDVPFFIYGGTALATHFGEKITPLPHPNLKITIIPRSAPTPDKTQQAYASLDLSKCGHNTEKTQKLLQAIKNNDHDAIPALIHNDFEQLYVLAPKEHLSGSGPSVFCI